MRGGGGHVLEVLRALYARMQIASIRVVAYKLSLRETGSGIALDILEP